MTVATPRKIGRLASSHISSKCNLAIAEKEYRINGRERVHNHYYVNIISSRLYCVRCERLTSHVIDDKTILIFFREISLSNCPRQPEVT